MLVIYCKCCVIHISGQSAANTTHKSDKLTFYTGVARLQVARYVFVAWSERVKFWIWYDNIAGRFQ